MESYTINKLDEIRNHLTLHKSQYEKYRKWGQLFNIATLTANSSALGFGGGTLSALISGVGVSMTVPLACLSVASGSLGLVLGGCNKVLDRKQVTHLSLAALARDFLLAVQQQFMIVQGGGEQNEPGDFTILVENQNSAREFLELLKAYYEKRDEIRIQNNVDVRRLIEK